MIKIRSYFLRSLALVGAVLLSPAIAGAQGQTSGQMPAQSSTGATGGAMPGGGMMDDHDAMPGMAGAPMKGGMQMSPSKPTMAQDKPGCCGMKMKAMGKQKPSAKHRRHAKPAAAKAAPMPADKPMPMKDDM